MNEPGKRAALHVGRINGLNMLPVNDVLVFMFEHGVAADAIREFTERTGTAIKELDERAAKEAAEKKARDEEWGTKLKARKGKKL